MGKRFIGSLILLFAIPSFAQADSIVRVGACKTPGFAWNVVLQDDYAYIADRGYVSIVNVSVPSNPWVAGSLNSGPPVGALGIFLEDTIVYCNLTVLGNAFVTVSIANPESLYLLGECNTPADGGLTHWGVCKIDTVVYLANGAGGMVIIDVSDPSSPDTISSYSFSGQVMDLATKDTFLYVTNLDSLIILNISDLLNPFQVGAVAIPFGAVGVAVKGNYAYVTDNRLQSVNVEDPTSPYCVDDISIKGEGRTVYISGHYAYVAACDEHCWPKNGKYTEAIKIKQTAVSTQDSVIEGGVRIVDITYPDKLELVATYDTPGSPHGVFAKDSLVFVADWDSLVILKHIKTGIEEREKLKLQSVELKVYPSPFKRQVAIEFTVPFSANACLEIYDAVGRKVRTLYNGILWHTTFKFYWNGKDDYGKEVAVGKYFVTLTPEGLWAPTGEEIIYLK